MASEADNSISMSQTETQSKENKQDKKPDGSESNSDEGGVSTKSEGKESEKKKTEGKIGERRGSKEGGSESGEKAKSESVKKAKRKSTKRDSADKTKKDGSEASTKESADASDKSGSGSVKEASKGNTKRHSKDGSTKPRKKSVRRKSEEVRTKSNKETAKASSKEETKSPSIEHEDKTEKLKANFGELAKSVSRAEEDLTNSKFDINLLEDEEEENCYDVTDVFYVSDYIIGGFVAVCFLVSLIAFFVVLVGVLQQSNAGSPHTHSRSRRDIMMNFFTMRITSNTSTQNKMNYTIKSNEDKPRSSDAFSDCFYVKKRSFKRSSKMYPYSSIQISFKDYLVLGFNYGIQQGHTLRNVFVTHEPDNRTSYHFVGYRTSTDSKKNNSTPELFNYSMYARIFLCPLAN